MAFWSDKVMENFPLISVRTPVFVPFTTTFTPGIASRVDPSVTVPEIVSCWSSLPEITFDLLFSEKSDAGDAKANE